MPTQARINGTAKEKIKWLQQKLGLFGLPPTCYMSKLGENMIFSLSDSQVVLGENGKWWIEEVK